MKYNVAKNLIKLANHLDSKGFAKEASYIDDILKLANQATVFSAADRDRSIGSTDSDYSHIAKITVSFIKYSKKLKNKNSLSDYEKQLTGFIAYKDTYKEGQVNQSDFASLFLTNDLDNLNDIAKCVFDKKLDEACKKVSRMLQDCISAGTAAHKEYIKVGKNPDAFSESMKALSAELGGDYVQLCNQDNKAMKEIEEVFSQNLGTVDANSANEIAALASLNSAKLRECRRRAIPREQAEGIIEEMEKIREGKK